MDYDLILRIKYNKIDIHVSFFLTLDVKNLATNTIEREKKKIDSKLIKKHNKQLLKVCFSYQAFVDGNSDIYLFKMMEDNIILPDVEIKMDYIKFSDILSKWSKNTYSKLKALIVSDIKSMYYIQYIFKIIESTEKDKYKKASPKQLLGNPIAYFNRNCETNLDISFFHNHNFEQCRHILRTKKFNFYIDNAIKDLLLKCRKRASNIFYLDLESLILDL